MKLFLPYRSELGHIIMHHAPWVNSFNEDKIVILEAGLDCLYPGAKDYIYCGDKPDGARREWRKYDSRFLEYCETCYVPKIRKKYGKVDVMPPLEMHPESNENLKYFSPVPAVDQEISRCDIVCCPRQRRYGERKNWELWPEVLELLSQSGVETIAVGQKKTSYPTDTPNTYTARRTLDAAVQAIQGCRAVLATDSGLAHLAIMCGKPLLMVSSRGKTTAPGYPRIKTERFTRANHSGSYMKIIDGGWESPKKVIEESMEFLENALHKAVWKTEDGN